LKLRNIKVLHLEPTDVCQAACALCARELDPLFNKSKKHHLTIAQIEKVFSNSEIKLLDKMFMCGNYGDPAAGTYTLDIYRHFRAVNPNIVLGMNTNGAIQNTAWWLELGRLFNQTQDYCVFSIDGLADTNHIYRRNVSWDNLIANAKAFIAAGGSAHWDMLVYKHNEHQVDACEQLARDLGFTWFRAKVSKRPFEFGVEAPVGWLLPIANAGKIDCHALQEQSLYIDAQGRVSPCCWLGATQIDFVKYIEEVSSTWNTNSPNTVCAATCSVDNSKTVFKNQWQREVELC
jgi:MoaA/NifB/PqqE/SkfB family radical SAM enzyme